MGKVRKFYAQRFNTEFDRVNSDNLARVFGYRTRKRNGRKVEELLVAVPTRQQVLNHAYPDAYPPPYPEAYASADLEPLPITLRFGDTFVLYDDLGPNPPHSKIQVLLNFFVPVRYSENLWGCLRELYIKRLVRIGKERADSWYRKQVFLAIRHLCLAVIHRVTRRLSGG